jgi:hypothetical protein
VTCDIYEEVRKEFKMFMGNPVVILPLHFSTSFPVHYLL